MKVDADVDIDFADRDFILGLIKHVHARQSTNSVSKHHNSGVYVTDIPFVPIHSCSSIEYKDAETRGYFKIDFLNVNVYKEIKNQQHYDILLGTEPPWDMLCDDDFSSKVIHIGNHHSLLATMKPDNIPRMAMFLALIRPGKKHLIGRSWEEISVSIWDKPSSGYYFKKAHAVSYAVLVGLHMNILNQHREST
jgi:DNA polymerase III alpha subunit